MVVMVTIGLGNSVYDCFSTTGEGCVFRDDHASLSTSTIVNREQRNQFPSNTHLRCALFCISYRSMIINLLCQALQL